MKRAQTLLVVVAGLALLAAACSGDDDGSDNATGGDADRTVEVDMVDIAFEPDTLQVERGETVRFVFTNQGEVAHDAFIGDEDAQADHEAEMREAEEDGHDDGHGEEDEDALTLEPGDTGELTYTFDEVGTIEIGCHEPGHYEAGMKVTVEVA